MGTWGSWRLAFVLARLQAATLKLRAEKRKRDADDAAAAAGAAPPAAPATVSSASESSTSASSSSVDVPGQASGRKVPAEGLVVAETPADKAVFQADLNKPTAPTAVAEAAAEASAEESVEEID